MKKLIFIFFAITLVSCSQGSTKEKLDYIISVLQYNDSLLVTKNMNLTSNELKYFERLKNDFSDIPVPTGYSKGKALRDSLINRYNIVIEYHSGNESGISPIAVRKLYEISNYGFFVKELAKLSIQDTIK